MPGSTTASWRIGYAASPPTAGFRIRRKSYSISPGGMIPESIVSVAKLLPDDRRVARMGLVGDGWAAGIHNVAADHQALARSALWSCRRRSRRLVSLNQADTRGCRIWSRSAARANRAPSSRRHSAEPVRLDRVLLGAGSPGTIR